MAKILLQENPIGSSGIFSKILFLWLIPLFVKGYRLSLEKEDLYEISKEDTSEVLGDRISRNWNKELSEAELKKRTPSYIRALCTTFGFHYCLAGVLVFCEECIIKIGQPLCLGLFIRYFNKDGGYSDNYIGIVAAFGIALCSFLFICTRHRFIWVMMNTGMKCRIASCSLMYRKALRLNSAALGQTTVGQMVNLLSNDVRRFDTSLIQIHYIWVAPIQTVLATWILWQDFGPSCLAGIAILIIYIPLQSYMSRVFSRLRLKTAQETDKRIRIMNEIVNAIRVIKMYAWEIPFTAMITEARRKELNTIIKTNYFRAINLTMFVTSSKMIIFMVLLVYAIAGNILKAEKVFVALALINNIRISVTMFLPMGVSLGSEAAISCKRIQKFLLLEEKGSPERNEKLIKKPKKQSECNVEVRHLFARWDLSSSEDDLKNISFRVSAGQLLAVVGTVGAGKSSLLHTILSELSVTKGLVDANGKVAYVSQEPWLFSGSIRDNVLFGQPFDYRKYCKVIKVCALDKDIASFPDKDQTMVGERGVALSGGQKTRINLARAVYFDADIYLLDDPLSAVDANVGKHLFEKCISKFLSQKVCILVTHQHQYLKTADQILVLDNGCMQSQRPGNQPTDPGIDIASIVCGNLEKVPEMMSDKNRRLRRGSISWNEICGPQTSIIRKPSMVDVEDNPTFENAIVGLVSRASVISLGIDILELEDLEKTNAKEGTETKVKGKIESKIYASYFRAGGGFLMLVTMFIMVITAETLNTGISIWLSYWTKSEEISKKFEYQLIVKESVNMTYPSIDQTAGIHDTRTNVYIYTGMTVALLFVTLIKTAVFYMLTVMSSKNLHLRMFTSVIRTPVKFFDTHPVGQILNRFTNDLGLIDEVLPQSLHDLITIGTATIGITVTLFYVNVWSLIPTFFCILIFYFIRMVFLASSREIKRLEGITRSPVFSHLSCSLQGITTIRAFEAQDTFIKDFDEHQDLHSSAWYLIICITTCFGIWLDFLAFVYSSIVTFSFLLIPGDWLGSDVGLAVSATIVLSGMLQWGVKQSAEVENQMTSVERILAYSQLEPEELTKNKEKERKKVGWPSEGNLSFQNVTLRYNIDDSPVLKNISFSIKAGQKIGIVGRTGAGKSSLLTCLFRLTQPEGTILIDDVDTDSIPLCDLRESISIIPQDPTLFDGTVRKNLDPFSSHTDEEIWIALEEVQLKQTVSEMSDNLSAAVSEGGHNLSVGQRQLICLARAILRKNKILVMDEATSNVDPKTDECIQQTIRFKFVKCTVLAIAHRLHTIIDSDKVIVMDAGRVKEFDSPYELLKDDCSVFSELVRQTGLETEKKLRDLAEKAYNSKQLLFRNNFAQATQNNFNTEI